MSKELNKILLQVEDKWTCCVEDAPRTFAEEVAMEYAEKVAVAFAEWVNQWYDLKIAMSMNRVYTLSDLYQYFINNVYNQ